MGKHFTCNFYQCIYIFTYVHTNIHAYIEIKVHAPKDAIKETHFHSKEEIIFKTKNYEL